VTPQTVPEPADRNPSVRASDADRDLVAQALGTAFSEGRLNAAEHGERLELAYAARTMGDLYPLVSDLPTDLAPPGATAARQTRTGLTGPFTDGETVVALFGETKRAGRWLVRPGLMSWAVFGSVELDLTEAVLEQRDITITANALFGEVKLRVPDSVAIIDEGGAVFGSRKLRAGSPPITPDTPVIRVRGVAVFGKVEAKRPKRKWLRR
jgi:Domain of unknown function (DUF1707)/Cell wall-active antibiotics response 4TMS YvqF